MASQSVFDSLVQYRELPTKTATDLSRQAGGKLKDFGGKRQARNVLNEVATW